MIPNLLALGLIIAKYCAIIYLWMLPWSEGLCDISNTEVRSCQQHVAAILYFAIVDLWMFPWSEGSNACANLPTRVRSCQYHMFPYRVLSVPIRILMAFNVISFYLFEFLCLGSYPSGSGTFYSYINRNFKIHSTLDPNPLASVYLYG